MCSCKFWRPQESVRESSATVASAKRERGKARVFELGSASYVWMTFWVANQSLVAHCPRATGERRLGLIELYRSGGVRGRSRGLPPGN